MFYYLYVITNLVNGKTYIGAHQTTNMDDGYMGSGKLITSAIKKYGLENFVKDIIEEFDNQDDMYKRESEIVNEDYCRSEKTYNIALGGSGGSILKNRRPFNGPHSEITKEKLSKLALGRKLTEQHKQKLSDNHWTKKDPEAQRAHARQAPARNRDNETKNKIANSMRGKVNNPGGRVIKKTICPKCKKEGSEMAMRRWHFEHCRN